MNDTMLLCQDERRRRRVREHEAYNGLDYLEVSDDQRILTVYFLDKAPKGLTMRHVRITGGRRVRDIQVVDLEIRRRADPDLDDCMDVTVDRPGDFSTYRLCLVDLDAEGRPTDRPFPGFDPRYACLDFSFKEGCPSDLDCKVEPVRPPVKRDEPEINYLAKDYASFRQLILDRLALIMPDWQERHVPDIGIALVEVLAYVGDHLSYYQDAVATEAYLATARQRISVRRHARLVDYQMHEGCNARAWVHVRASQDQPLDADDVYFVTDVGEALQANQGLLTPDDLRTIPAGQYEVFEPLIEDRKTPIRLYKAHNEIEFYTWGDAECCLLRGATSATLKDRWIFAGKGGEEAPPPRQTKRRRNSPGQQQPPKPEPRQPVRELSLRPGDYLLFEEVIGPETGNPSDANPRHRHVVRLTRVEPGEDLLVTQRDPETGQEVPTPVLEIEWAEADALPFPVCISTIGPAPECESLENVSLARGNIILVDHGWRVEDENLGHVPVETTTAECPDPCHPAEVRTISGKFRPRLEEGPLVFSQPLPEGAPAARLLTQEPRQALPWLDVRSIPALPDGSDTLFEPGDLVDPTHLAVQLLKRSTPAARFLRSQLPSATQELLDQEADPAAPSAQLLAVLADNLQEMLVRWWPQPDLLAPPTGLAGAGGDYHFVAEVDNDGRAHLRFGDGELGRAPQAGSLFLGTFRIGGGPAGNVGAETIRHIVLRRTRLSGVSLEPRNPLPASGGTAPELLADVRLFAPHAFRSELQRAITAEDYAEIVRRDFGTQVQRAAGALRWTGSWYEVLVAVDPRGKAEADPEMLAPPAPLAGLAGIAGEAGLANIKKHLHRYRRIGHDLAVKWAHYVPLDIELTVCVLPDYLRGHVKAELLNVFSNRLLPDGRLGFFHPDNLTFGEGVFLSKLVAAAQAVVGVENVVVDKLERLYEGPNQEIEKGVLSLGPLEVARLDNDPSFPENGKLTLNMVGGR